MTLLESIEVWETKRTILNHNEKYLDSSPIDSRINRELLLEFILAEYADMKVLFADSRFMHRRVELFFYKNEDRIKRLLDTLDLEYDPLEDSRSTTNERSREEAKQTHSISENGETIHFISAYNQIDLSDTKSTRDTATDNENGSKNDDKTGNVDTVYSGMMNHTYQELIDRQRRTVLFDIEDFILEEFAKELLIAVW